MSSAPGHGGRRRSLQDELLEDLRQGALRPAAAPPPELPPEVSEASPRRSARSASPTPAVELRFTPRSWSGVGWMRRPGEAGLTVSFGPVCLSLGVLHLG